MADDDLLGRDARSQQLQDLHGDQLGLGALPTGLEQPHRAARIETLAGGLEQPALERVQRDPGAGLVVLVERRQLEHPRRQRGQLRHSLRARAQRIATRLVRQRHRHLDADHPRERLDRVALERVQIVEAVEEHRIRAPAARLRPQRVECPPRVQILVDPPYAMFSSFQPLLAERLPALLAADGVVVVESDQRDEPELPLAVRTSRRYGSARVTLFEHER